MEVISTEGERGRFAEDWELGEGESSGAGGGGRTKWKVREAICICDLAGCEGVGVVQYGMYVPLTQGHSAAATRPYSIDPCPIPSDNNQHESLLLFFILDLGVQPRDTLQWAKVDVNLNRIR